jgi:hypothetical protein
VRASVAGVGLSYSPNRLIGLPPQFGAAARGSLARLPPAPVMLCVDVLGFHISLEPSLELAHQRQ